MKTVDFRGTVSEGTMRPQDVLPAMMDVLKQYHPEAYQEVTGRIEDLFGFTYTELCGLDDHPAWVDENMSWIIYEGAWDAMNEIAPPGYYFGAHPGDGADYGYWLDDDWKEEEEDLGQAYTQGGGIVRWDILNKRWAFTEPPEGFEVGDFMPEAWGIVSQEV